MPYNGSGTFSILNTFVPSTVILSANVNANFSDIAANGLSLVYTLDGQAGLTAQLKAIAGTATAPGWSFTNDLTTGGYLPSTGQLGLAAAGSVILTVKNSVPSSFARGISIASNVGIVGDIIVGGTATFSGGFNATVSTGTFNNVIVVGTASVRGNTALLGSLNVSGSVNFTDVLTLNGAGTTASFMKMAAGTTAERPPVTAGRTRYNSSTANLEFSDGVSWINATGGTVFLSSKSASAGNFDFTSVLSSTYNDYLFVLSNVKPSTDDSQILMQYSVDNTNFLATSYLSFGTGANSGGSVTTAVTTAVALSLAGGGGNGVGNDSTYGLNGIIYVSNVNSALLKITTVQSYYLASTGTAIMTWFQGGGVYTGATTAINAIRFTGGTLNAGTIKCYGLKPS